MAGVAARRYARAIFDLSQEDGIADMVLAGLRSAERILTDSQVRAIVSNPVIPPSRRIEVIDVAAPEDLAPETRNLAKMLIESGQTSLIGEILEEFQRLADESAGRVRATVTTAVELDSDAKGRVAQELSKRLGREVTLWFHVDRAILGGMVLQVGDRLRDASVRGRLQQLRRELAG
jgi:F-type H+-transporting ATPase subunit delta